MTMYVFAYLYYHMKAVANWNVSNEERSKSIQYVHTTILIHYKMSFNKTL